jgi:RND family efflux transporter MFP subunit
LGFLAIVALVLVVRTFILPLFQVDTTDLPVTGTATMADLHVTVSERGELEAIDAVNVQCELEGGGKLVHIVPEGTVVKKGEVVAQLDPDALTKLLNEQRVKLQAAEGKVLTCQSEVIQARSKEGTENAKADKTLKLARIALKKYTDPQGEYTKEVEKLKGAREEAKKNLQDAQAQLQFAKEQLKKGFGEVNTVTSLELAVQQNQNRLNSATAELRVLEIFTREENETKLKFEADDAEREVVRTREAQKSLVEKAENELETAKSTRDIEKETLERIQKQIDRCTIKAPSDGIVLYSNRRWYGDSGQIRPGSPLEFQQPIFSLPNFSKMRVKMRVHESQIKKVQLEQKAELKLEAVANRVLRGTVTKIGELAQNDGYWGSRIKAYETLINLDEVPTDAGLKPGMSAEVKILVRRVPDALVVPVSAVAEIEGQKVVYAVASGMVQRRPVEIGDENEQFVQILSGLSMGEAVALDARTRAAADLKSSKSPGK